MEHEINSVSVGEALKNIRLKNAWTLVHVAEKTGLSISTLSKLENGKSQINYTKLMALCNALSLDIAEILTIKKNSTSNVNRLSRGARSITRAGSETVVTDPMYTNICHAADLLRRQMHPMFVEIHARSIEEFGNLRSHPGEEFSIVVDGAVDLYSEEYAPVRLNVGDSIYFDCGVGHAFIAAGEGLCRILSVFSESHDE